MYSRSRRRTHSGEVRRDSLNKFRLNFGGNWYCLIEKMFLYITPFAVHYETTRNYLRETATNSAKIHSLTRKYEHLRINQIQLRFLHFNQHSITLLGIHMRHWAHKREKFTFINANTKVINTILKVNRDN